MKILIVDDSPEKVALIRSIIMTDGFEPEVLVVASNGLEAREALSTRQFDFLLVDIALPLRAGDPPDVRGGFNLLVELERSARFYKPSSVLALTGYQELEIEFYEKFDNGIWSVDLYDPSDSGWRDRLRAKLAYLLESIGQSKAGAYDRDVCIITALPQPELDAVRKLPWDFGPAVAFGSVAFRYSGKLKGAGRDLNVDAIAAPRMGMVASAALTTRVILELRPRLIIMAGICAGMPGETELGDLILADPTWDWQMGKYTLENFEIQPDQIGAPVEVTQRFTVLNDDRHALLAIAEGFAGERPKTVPTIHVGPLASGSAVIANPDQGEMVKLQNRKLIGFDMEAYGVYSAVRDAPQPRPSVFALKGVCDHADHYKNDKYQSYASYISSQVIRLYLERFGL